MRLLTGSTIVPKQLAIMRRSPGQQVLPLCLDTSLFIYQERGNFPERIVMRNGVRVMEMSEALLRVSETFYRENPDDAVIALRMLRDPTMLLSRLLEHGRSTVSGRLAGAFRHIGDTEAADRIVSTMRSAGYDVRESNPFDKPVPLPYSQVHPRSPYVPRLQGMWAKMRGEVVELFPDPSSRFAEPQVYLTQLEEKYVQDAYHSLSIEGYQVTPTLIEKVRSGLWDTDSDTSDRATTAALAARGYWEAFQLVRSSVINILSGAEAISIIK